MDFGSLSIAQKLNCFEIVFKHVDCNKTLDGSSRCVLLEHDIFWTFSLQLLPEKTIMVSSRNFDSRLGTISENKIVVSGTNWPMGVWSLS